MRRKLKTGTTSQQEQIFIPDTSSTVGGGLGSLVFNTTGLAAKYRRKGDSSWTAITLQTKTLGTFATGGGGFIADGGGVTGGYEFDIPNAALANAGWCIVQIYGAANMLPVWIDYELDAVDYQDTVRFGLTALPNVVQGNAGQLATADASARVDIGKWIGTAPLALFSQKVQAISSDAATAGDFTAAMKTSLNAATPAVTVSDKTGFSLSAPGVQAIWDALTSALVTVGSIGKWLVDRLDQTVGSRMATYTQPTGFLATAFPAGTVASSTEVTAIQNNTRTVIVVPEVIERTGSVNTYKVHMYIYDENGNMEAPDSAPTLALVNQTGTSLVSRVNSTTGALVNSGHYSWTYTNTITDTLEQLLWEFTVIEGGATRLYGRQSIIVDVTAVDFTSADRTVLNSLDTRIPAALTGAGNIKADSLKLNGATPLTEISIRTEMDANSTKFATLVANDVTIASYIDTEITSLLADTAFLKKFIQADQVIDTTTTPWNVVWYDRGTATELLRKRVKKVDGSNVTSTDDIPGGILQ